MNTLYTTDKSYAGLTLLLYSSMKLPKANLKRLSDRTLQFILYTVQGASYLYISFLLGGAECTAILSKLDLSLTVL